MYTNREESIDSIPSVSMRPVQTQKLTISLQEFSQAWNQQIRCRTSCEFYQYRLRFIDHIKSLFLHKYQQLIDSFFTQDEEKYHLRSQKIPKLIGVSSEITVSIQVSYGSSVYKLNEQKPRTIFDRLRGTKQSQIIIRVVDPQKPTSLQCSAVCDFYEKLQQLLLYFVVQQHRIKPALLEENENANQAIHDISYQQLQRIKDQYSIKYQLHLIDKSKSTLNALLQLIENPALCTYFNMSKVFHKHRVKYLYKQPIMKSDADDLLTFQQRNFSLEGFTKHISYLIPFWFTLELVFESQFDQQSYCEVVVIPPMFQSEQEKNRLNQKVKNYIINLSEAANTKVLLMLMEKTHMCPITPYELFVNSKLNAQLREKSQSKNKSSFPALKDLDSLDDTVFKVPFLNVSAYPLYERFADGNGIDNIKKSDLWKHHTILNLEDSYVIKFKNEVFIVTFREILPYKQKKNLPESMKTRKLLIYEVYGLELGVTKQEFDFEFRRRIRQAQLEPLLNKISQHLIKAPQVLSQSQVNIFQRGKKLSFRVRLPYMSCYGLYLCYLRQKLNYIHRKTSRKRYHHSTRKFSSLETCCEQFREQHKFTSFIEDNNNFQAYQYFYNEEDQMLCLFNYAAARGNEDQPFGNCIYLLDISMINNGIKIDQMIQYIDRQSIPTGSKKKSFYIQGVDPTETMGNKFKEVKELIQSLNEIFPQQNESTGSNKRDSDVLSSSSSISSDIVASQNYCRSESTRPYENLELEFNYQIIGHQNFEKIQEYCQKQIQGTYCDYLIEAIIFRLKKIADDYINLDIQLMSKKKRRLSFDDIQPIIEENLNNLLRLSRMSSMKRSLTIFNFQIEQMYIFQPRHLYTLLVQLSKNVIDIVNQFMGTTNKRPQMVYYIMNSHQRLICYGCLSKLVITGSQDHNVFIKSLNKDVEVGLLFGSHLSHFFEKIEQEKKKTDWIQGIKHYPDGKFFGNDAFNFKRNFLMQLSINSEGVKYFSYNANRNINYQVVKNMQVIAKWNKQKKLLLEALLKIRNNERVTLPHRQPSKPYLYIDEEWDPYQQLIITKQSQRRRKPKTLSLTQLFKNLVFQLVPPITEGQCIDFKQEQVNRIYELLMKQKIDIAKFGQLPKTLQYKCELSRLGFQVLSILRYNFIKEMKKKQDQQDV